MSSTPYPKTDAPLASRHAHAYRWHYLVIALLVLIGDQLTKWLVMQDITLHDSIHVVPGFFQLTHIENQGAAFGLFADSPSQWRIVGLIVFSLIALVVVSILLWKNSHRFTYGGVALALILGGALGNLWDRIFDGHVVDFLDFYVGSAHWPAFNVADSAIVIGAILLVAEILFSSDEAAAAA